MLPLKEFIHRPQIWLRSQVIPLKLIIQPSITVVLRIPIILTRGDQILISAIGARYSRSTMQQIRSQQ